MSKVMQAPNGPMSEEQRAVFKAALAQQERQRAIEEGQAVPENRAPAIFGENKGAGRRLYGSPHKGIIDWGLRTRIYGRSDRNAKVKERGRQMGKPIHCVG